MNAPPTSPCPRCRQDVTPLDSTYGTRRGWSCIYRHCGALWAEHGKEGT